MKKTLIFFAFCLFSLQASAQVVFPAGKLYVLHEGSSSQKGSLGFISYPSQTYTHIDSVPAFGNDLIVDQTSASVYICTGDGSIRKYHAITDTLVWTSNPIGARSAQVYQNNLVVACNLSPFVKVIKTQDGTINYTIGTNRIPNETESVAILGSKAYISENGVNGFGVNGVTDSTIAVVDLDSQQFVEDILVAKNPNKIITKGNSLWVQCLNYTAGMTISEVDLSSNLVTNRNSQIVSYGGFAANAGLLYFGMAGSTIGIGTYSFVNQSFNSSFSTANVYGMEFLTNDILLVTQTDFFSSGSVSVLNLTDGTISNTVQTHISPRAMGFYSTGTVSVDPDQNPVQWFVSESVLTIQSKDSGEISIFSIEGKQMKVFDVNAHETQYFSLSELPSGIYFAKFKNEVLKFWKF